MTGRNYSEDYSKGESGIRVQRRWILYLSKELLIELVRAAGTARGDKTSRRMAAPGRSEVLLGPQMPCEKNTTQTSSRAHELPPARKS